MELDQHAVEDLTLYLINTREFYNRTEQLRKRFKYFYQAGNFQFDKARNILDKFILEHINKSPDFLKIYTADYRQYFKGPNKQQRQEVAKRVLDYYMEEIKDENSNNIH